MASIRSFGRYLPDQVLTNHDLAEKLGCTPEWIYEVSGIEERRVAKEQSVASLAVRAAQDCLDRSGVSALDVKLVIVSSASAEQRFPGPAALVAKELGLAGIPALDLPVASAGSLFALVVASQLAGVYGMVLVVAAEKMTAPALREPLNKNVAILFGDGAGACLVDPADTGLQLRNHALHSDGSFAEDLKLGLEGTVKMNGLTVIMQASRKLPSAIAEVLTRGRGRAHGSVDVSDAPGESKPDRPGSAGYRRSIEPVLHKHPSLRKYIVGIFADRGIGMA